MFVGVFEEEFTVCHRDTKHTMRLSDVRHNVCFRELPPFQKAMTAGTKCEYAAPQPEGPTVCSGTSFHSEPVLCASTAIESALV